MSKKIISLVVLLVLLLSMAATYIVINQKATEKENGLPEPKVSDDEINNEVNNAFLNENSEVNIGEMV